MLWKKTLAFVAGAITISACTVYHPQAVDIPLMTKQGETKIDASCSLSGWIIPDASSFNVTATHAFTDCFAGQAHLNYGGGMGAAQLAFGAFKPFGEHFVLEGYMGLNSGFVNVDERDDDDDSSGGKYSYNGRFNVPFSQMNFGWHDLLDGHFDIGFALKGGAYMPSIHYYEYNSDGTIRDEETEHYKKTNLLIEPQFMMRLGPQKVKWIFKAGFCDLNDIAQGSENFIYDFYTLSMGVHITF